MFMWHHTFLFFDDQRHINLPFDKSNMFYVSSHTFKWGYNDYVTSHMFYMISNMCMRRPTCLCDAQHIYVMSNMFMWHPKCLCGVQTF